MIDFLAQSRQAMIDNFQISLRAIRTLMGYSALDIATYIGVTRQTVNNLETGKAKMSPTQYMAIAAVVDNYLISNGEMFDPIVTILDGNGKKRSEHYDTSFSNFSMVKRWFACFKDTADLDTAAISYNNVDEYRSLLQRFASKYKVFIDADVLLEPKSGEFLNLFANNLIKQNAKLIIPMRAIEQIQELAKDISVADKAVRALKLVNVLQQKNIVQFRGEDSDSNIHDTILSVFAKFRRLHRLCLITQNELFSDEVKRLNENSEKQGFDIVVGYVDKTGVFALYPRQIEPPLEFSAQTKEENCFDAIIFTEELSENNDCKEVAIEMPLKLTGWGQL